MEKDKIRSSDEHIAKMKAADNKGVEIQQRHPKHCPLWLEIPREDIQQHQYGCKWLNTFEYRIAPEREEPKPGTAYFVIDGKTVELKLPTELK